MTVTHGILSLTVKDAMYTVDFILLY